VRAIQSGSDSGIEVRTDQVNGIDFEKIIFDLVMLVV
jgi:hypothetical protein